MKFEQLIDAPPTPRRRFFIRGLAIVLPTVLTIWLLVIAYQFLAENIAKPINAGLKTLVVSVSPWPEATGDDYSAVILTPAQEDAWNIEEEKLREQYGDRFSETIRIDRRRAWMKEQPATVHLARRHAVDRYWNTVMIGTWAVMDLIGLVVAVVLIYIIGLLLSGFIGRRLYTRTEEMIARVPLVRRVYPSVKQVTDFFFDADRKNVESRFNRVVAVQYPRLGIWSVGLVTGDTMQTIQTEAGRKCLTVFVPSSPTPFTGYVITVPEDDTLDLDITIEDALKFAVSLGVLVPPRQQIEDQSKPDVVAAQTVGATPQPETNGKET